MELAQNVGARTRPLMSVPAPLPQRPLGWNAFRLLTSWRNVVLTLIRKYDDDKKGVNLSEIMDGGEMMHSGLQL